MPDEQPTPEHADPYRQHELEIIYLLTDPNDNQPLWALESGWNIYASNPSSGAYGIPQALPGSKMASAGPDWQGDAATQIRWGLSYIQGTYGSPCAAWSHEEADGWY